MQSTMSALARAGDLIKSQTGWRRAGLAFATGAVTVFSFAPFGIFPLFLLSVAVLVLLLDAAQTRPRPHRSALWIGWCWAFGQFLFGLYWVGYAFLVQADEHAWQIPFVEVLLPGGLALFIALATTASSFFWRSGASRIFALAVAYGACEWLRGHAFTGFPWNLPAYIWGASLGVLQTTALFGSYALSMLTVLLGASLAEFASRERRQLPLAVTALFVLFWVGGEARLALTHPGDVPGVHLRLVQPNVPQKEKLLRRYWERNWRNLVELSARHADPRPNIIVWPEAAPPYIFTRVPAAMHDIAVLTGTNGVLMTGAVRVFFTPDDRMRASNSLEMFGPGAKLLAAYDKFHLVPFGEYVPLADLFDRLGISQVVDEPTGFAAGDGPHTYALPSAPPVGPLICYEVLFPGDVVGEPRPGWIVNVTDDSWFGPSIGPYQHLLTARIRAIEEGLPIARAANTGISAVIDPLGRVPVQLGLEQFGVVDSPLPKAVPKTPFARFGDTGLVLVVLVLGWGAWRRGDLIRRKGDEKSFS